MDKMVHAVEKRQKTLNCLESNNFRRRQRINTLRKDRAVFDKIFKGIEMKILSEERQMIKRIKSLRKQEARLAKVRADLVQLEKVIGRDHREKLVREIQSVYKKNFLDYSGQGDDEEFLNQLDPEGEFEVVERSAQKLLNVISVDPKKRKTEDPRPRSKYSRMRKFDFKIDKEKMHEAIHQKKEILEGLEQKLEMLKRLVEESSIERISQIFTNGPQMCAELHSQFDQTTREVFELETTHQKLEKEHKELQKEVNELQTEKTFIKRDWQESDKKGEYKMDANIRKDNRARDDESLQPGNLPEDTSRFEKWESRTAEVDEQLEKYLAIFLDIARNTFFDVDEVRDPCHFEENSDQATVKMEPIESGKTLLERPMENISQVVEGIENWVNMFVIIQKRNILGEKDCNASEQSFKKSPEYRRRLSRRKSKRHSFRKSIVSNQSMRKVSP